MTTSRAIRRAFDAGFEALDLNLTQALLLAYVARFGPMTQTQLADCVGIGRAAAGAIIDALHDRGAVRRDADPHDRRVWRVSVTPRGAELAAKVDEVDATLCAQLRAGIGRTERQQLVQLLLQLHANALAVLDEADPEEEH